MIVLIFANLIETGSECLLYVVVEDIVIAARMLASWCFLFF